LNELWPSKISQIFPLSGARDRLENSSHFLAILFFDFGSLEESAAMIEKN